MEGGYGVWWRELLLAAALRICVVEKPTTMRPERLQNSLCISTCLLRRCHTNTYQRIDSIPINTQKVPTEVKSLQRGPLP